MILLFLELQTWPYLHTQRAVDYLYKCDKNMEKYRKGKLLGKTNPFILCKDTWYKTENGEAIQAGPPTRYWQQTAAAYL
jgi:hypothetical protein